MLTPELLALAVAGESDWRNCTLATGEIDLDRLRAHIVQALIVFGDERAAEARAEERGTPCVICNDWHKGAPLDHRHQDADGCGYVRLLVRGGVEFCWRCSCRKSSWANAPNEQSDHCADFACVCHIAKRAT